MGQTLKGEVGLKNSLLVHLVSISTILSLRSEAEIHQTY